MFQLLLRLFELVDEIRQISIGTNLLSYGMVNFASVCLNQTLSVSVFDEIV